MITGTASTDRYDDEAVVPGSGASTDRPAAAFGRVVTPLSPTAMSFQVEARDAHAWFARSAPSRQVARLRTPSAVPALREAEGLLAIRARPIARRATRIPADAVVPVRSGRPASTVLLLTGPTQATANDNASAKTTAPSFRRAVYRQIFFLLVLAATLAGTFYIGRVNGFQKIIEVPEPAGRHSSIALAGRRVP